MRRIPRKYWYRVARNWLRFRRTPPPFAPPRPPEHKPSQRPAGQDAVFLGLLEGKRSHPIRYAPALDEAAQMQSDWMAETGRFEHGHLYESGECIALTWVPDVREAFRIWMASPPHRRIMLASYHVRFGLGLSIGRRGEYLWTANFGR